MLRHPGLVLGRWARFVGTLFNSKSDKLGLDIIEGPLQWPITHTIGVEPTENELIGALRGRWQMQRQWGQTNSLLHDPTVLREFHRVIKQVWHQRKYRSDGEMP